MPRTWLTIVVASLLLLACHATDKPPKRPKRPSPQVRPQATPQQAYTAMTPKEEAALTHILMQELLNPRFGPKRSYDALRRLGQSKSASPRLRALASLHAQRIRARQRKHTHTQRRPGLPPKGWPQKPITRDFRNARYCDVLQELVSAVGARLQAPKCQPSRRVSLRLTNTPWSDAIRALVWGKGDRIKRSGQVYQVQPLPHRAKEQAFDIQAAEIPNQLRWIAALARKSKLALRVRRSPMHFAMKGLALYPGFGRARGTRQALVAFLRRCSMLAFPVQIQTFDEAYLGHGIVSIGLFIGLRYIPTPSPATRPTSRPSSRPVSRPSLPPFLTANQIRAVIRAEKRGVRDCFRRHRGELPSHKSTRLLVALQVAPQGHVTSAHTRPQRFQKLARCISQWAHRLRFPAVQRSTLIRYPFVFNTN